VGQFYSGNEFIDDEIFTSVDAYYTDPSGKWYLRGASQIYDSESLHYAEGYYYLTIEDIPVTPYVGASTGIYESLYAGAYFELARAEKSSLTMDLGVGRIDGEWQLHLELSVLFGPGANRPTISAFGFNVSD
jgi:hypothetical protein